MDPFLILASDVCSQMSAGGIATTVTVTSRSFVIRTLSSMLVHIKFRLCTAVGK